MMQGDLFEPAPLPSQPQWVLFCCLNPSTADAAQDDPTLRRMMGFAKRLGADVTGPREATFSACGRYRYCLRRGTLFVVNLYGWQATSPRDLDALADEVRIGPENDAAIETAATLCDTLIAGWGGSLPKGGEERAGAVLKRLARHQSVHCLGRTSAGLPRHPLYLPGGAELHLLRAKNGAS